MFYTLVKYPLKTQREKNLTIPIPSCGFLKLPLPSPHSHTFDPFRATLKSLN
jgi:hypothetical protein